MYSKYGSKKGFVLHIIFTYKYYFGLFEQFRLKNIQPDNYRLIFICKGNICRSPIGEYYALNRGLKSQSFGLNCSIPSKAHDRVAYHAQKLKLDLSTHLSKSIDTYEPQQNDILVLMEPDHFEQLPRKLKTWANITLLGLWSQNIRPYLHDPYSAPTSYIRTCTDNIVSGVDRLSQHLADKN